MTNAKTRAPAGELPALVQVTERRFRQMIDALPAAVYTTDANGLITHFNPACVELSGRTPKLHTDNWCVTWKLYHPDGTPMPHEECPMAVTLRERRAVRGAEAILERPDGTRIWFEPYPTPLFDADGNLTGGINMLVDITQRKQNEAAKALLAAVVENSDDAIITKNLDGVITSWNGSAVRLFGYTAAEAIGRPITMLLPRDRLDEEHRILARLKRGDRVDHLETRRVRKDGKLVDVSVTISPVRDAAGRIVGASKIAHDISERRRTETSGSLLAAIVQSSDDAIISKNLDGVITSWNSGAERLFGYTAAEAVGRSVTMLVPPDRLDEEHSILERLKWGERIDHLETRRMRKDGSVLDISLTISPVKDASGRTVGASKIARDITDKKLAEAALRDADRHKDEFLAMLGHELRNPLAPIRSSLDVMHHMEIADDDLRRCVEVIERQTTHVVRLVDDLLEMSRIASGALAIQMEDVPLNEAVMPAIEAVHPLITARRHRLSVDQPPQQIRVSGDAVRLTQILSNLLNNAAKYTPPGGEIRLSISADDTQAVVTVSDNGEGVANDQLKRIFEPFAQGAKASRSGLGIGLSFARRLAELHGGTIEAKSGGPGQGAAFTLRLPLLARDWKNPALRAARGAAAGLEGCRVLVVDDNADAAHMLGVFLRTHACDVRCAYDGASAVPLAQEFGPEVVLLDIALPDIDGYEVLRRLRAAPGIKPAVIALTGFAQPADVARMKEAGFDLSLRKPADAAALAARIGELRRRTA